MEKELLPYEYDDGGRSKYFRASNVGDCVCRAIAIASGRDYKEIYNLLYRAMGDSPRGGVMTSGVRFKRFMREQGFIWVSLCQVGSSQSAHFYKGEIPSVGRLVCSAHRHEVAVVNGVVRDTWDSRYNSWGEPRRIYGYWKYNR